MKFKLLFLLVFLPSILFSQGNFNLEYQYNYPSGDIFWGITKMKKNNGIYHIITINISTGICKFINGNTHSVEYTYNVLISDSSATKIPNLMNNYQDNYFSFMDVNNDGVFDFYSRNVNNGKVDIINGTNGQIIKTFNNSPGDVSIIDIDGDGFVELCVDAGSSYNIYSTPSTVFVNEPTTTVPDFKLKQNYPNPFNPSTKIDFSIKKNATVKLVLYDINGKEVSTIINEKRNAGSYSELVNGASLSTGTYFYQLIVEDVAEAKKMILIK